MPHFPLPANLVIRATCLQDAEGITALANLPGYRHGTLRMPFQTLEATRLGLANAARGSVGLVAECDGAIIGHASLAQHSGRRAHVGDIGMGVHDDWHGHGIGAALLAALIDVADNWFGLRRLELKAYTDNAAAIGLYQKFGFVIEGTLRADAMRDGVLVDSHAMARIVAPAPLQPLAERAGC